MSNMRPEQFENPRRPGFADRFAPGLTDPSRPTPLGVKGPLGKRAVKRYNVYRNSDRQLDRRAGRDLSGCSANYRCGIFSGDGSLSRSCDAADISIALRVRPVG